MDNKKWYAVICNNDGDWGEGSNNLSQAIDMARQCRANRYPDAYIAVIDDGNDPICIVEIRDF